MFTLLEFFAEHLLAQFPDLHVTVSLILQRNATAEDIEAHIDIADWFIREKLRPAGESIKRHSKEFLLVAQYLDPEKADEVEALIEDLRLMFMGAEKISGDISDEAPP